MRSLKLLSTHFGRNHLKELEPGSETRRFRVGFHQIPPMPQKGELKHEFGRARREARGRAAKRVGVFQVTRLERVIARKALEQNVFGSRELSPHLFARRQSRLRKQAVVDAKEQVRSRLENREIFLQTLHRIAI